MVSPENVVPIFRRQSKKEEEAWDAAGKITDSLFNAVARDSPLWGRTHDRGQSVDVEQIREMLDDAETALKSLEKPVPSTTANPENEMSTPTREEFEARLREMTTQMDNRALRTENKLDEILRKLETRDAVQDERLKGVGEKLQTISGEMEATRNSVGSLKTTVITTVLATGLAVTALIYTLNTSLFGVFESGKTTATALSDATNKLAQVSDKLDALSKKQATVESTAPAEHKSTPPVAAPSAPASQ
ncbi:hypothetical protein [Paraburkholderia caribensis]|uniref:hypothetical protein n=1 Tax=Paraburkholderia caribensis TaxID=75105 RepID=UPI001D08341D|nr:hypothetical protein [Paraburkholderia caribensis]